MPARIFHRVKDQFEEAGALHSELPLSRYVNDSVFHCKSGAFGVLIEVSGIDPECRLEDDLYNYSRRIEKALTILDERFRVYQYVIKRFGSPIPHKVDHPNERAQEFVSRRVRDLQQRSETLASVSIHLAILYEPPQIKHYFGLSTKRTIRELTLEDIHSVELLTSTVRAFISSIDDMLGFELLDESRGKLFFRQLLNPDPIHATEFHQEAGDRLDFVVADTDLYVHHNYLTLDDYYLTAASIKLTPSKPKPARIAAGLNEIQCDFVACMEWKPQSTIKMRKLIKAREKTFVAQGISVLQAAFAGAWTPKSEMPRKRDVEYHAENLGDCLEAIEAGSRFGAFSCVVILLGKDYQRVRNAFAELVRVYGQADGSLYKESLNLLSAYLSIVPGNNARNHSYSYLLSYDYANLTFAWQAYTGNPVNKHLKNEYLCLYETADQQLFYYNAHVGGTFGVFKTGAPESGKSYATVFEIANLQKYNPLTLILDIGGSYRDLTDYFHGAYYDISKGEQKTKMNPFSLPNTHENREFLFYFLRLLLGEHKTADPQKLASENKAIYDAIEGVFVLDPEHRRMKHLSLPANLQSRLNRWCEGGQYGHVFDHATDTVRLQDFQTFEFQGLEKTPEILAPMIFYVTQRFDQLVYDPSLISRLKVLIIDEGWRWLLNGEMGPYMVDKLKTGRKHNLCNMFITQSGLDAERAGFGQLLNEACPVKVFFANSDIRPETYETFYGLNPLQAERIAQLKPREELAIFATDPGRPAMKQFKVVKLKIDDAEDRLLCSNDPNSNIYKLQRKAVGA